jgi:hypothetical protein
MSEQAAIMVDTFLRVAGMSFIQASIQAACYLVAALIVLAVARLTERRR